MRVQLVSGGALALEQRDRAHHFAHDVLGLPNRVRPIGRARARERREHDRLMRLAALAQHDAMLAGERDLVGEHLGARQIELQRIGLEDRPAKAAGALIGDVERDRGGHRQLLGLRLVAPAAHGAFGAADDLGHLGPAAGQQAGNAPERGIERERRAELRHAAD